MLVGQIRYPAEAAQDVLGFYNEWIETVPDDLAVYGFMGPVSLPAHPNIKVHTVGLTPIFNGDARRGMDLIAPILKFPTVFINLYNMSLPDFEIYNGLLTVVAGKQGYIRSGYMPPKAFTPSAIETLTSAMGNAPSPDSLLVWTHTGGKVSTVAKDATAYWHRDARFLWEVKAIYSQDDEMPANVEWAYRLGEDMRPHDTGAYCNYIDPLLTNWKQEYYGGNYDELVRIKKEWDPKGHFNFQQAIGSPFEPVPGNLAPLFRTSID
jgi:hypothetical protein